MENLESQGNGSMTKPTVPDWLKNLIALVFVILFLAFVWVLVLNINSADKEWGRYLVIFNVVQTFAAAGGGVLLGTTIKSQEVKNAQDKEKAADGKASEIHQKGVALRDAIHSALQRSTSSPSKLFQPSRPVRPQRTGETTVYVADMQVQQPRHWVVEENETKEVDPELSGLAQLASNLFR
jgi:hypothetical protein